MRVQLTKMNIAGEPRLSRAGRTTPNHNDLRKAVVAANELAKFYSVHLQAEADQGRPKMIMGRDALQILGQMKNQRVYICQEVGKPEDNILAASLLWDEEIPVPSPTDPTGFEIVRFLELGTQLSVLNGFNLQWTLTAITLFEQLLHDPTGVAYAATYGDNVPSGRNFIQNMKFVEWGDVPPTVRKLRLHHLEAGPENELHRGVNWYRPTAATLVHAASRIVDLHDNSLQWDKTRKNSIEFSFDAGTFSTRGAFADILAAARDVKRDAPRTYAQFREIAGRDLGEQFVQFETSD